MICRILEMSVALVSTRDESQKPIHYGEAILAGLAPDGGLYTPHEIPKLSLEQIQDLPRDYAQLSTAIQSLYIDSDSISEQELAELLEDAYSRDNFDIRDGQVTPVEHIDGDIYLQELSLGPTAAFKDMALQSLGRQIDFILNKQNKTLRIVGATSGDTGSAAEHPFIGSEVAKVFMLSPSVGMSPFQKAQMGSLSGGNIHNLSVNGNFDDCQALVKQLNVTKGFEDLGALNSINWGRIVAQIAYYFSGYLQAVDSVGEEIDVVVPSGNFGNILAGHYARSMGLPIKTLVVATNENNVLDRAIKTDIYEEKRAEVTTSPSMDISKSSNLERLVYEIFDRDPKVTAEFMAKFNSTGKAELPKDSMKNFGFASGSSSKNDRLSSIAWTHDVARRLIDPHTADGITVARNHITEGQNNGRKVVVLSTALPVKFEQTVKHAIGHSPSIPPRFVGMTYSDDAFTTIENDIDQLASYVRKFS